MVTLKRLVFLSTIALLLSPAHAQFQQQGPKLVGRDVAGVPAQGKSVAVSADGNTAIVGGYFDGGNIGAAWVYVRAGGLWSQQGPKLVGTGASGTASQGISIALSADGNTAIVGGPLDSSGKGAAWVFTRAAGVWTQQGPKLTGAGTQQGRTVSLSGDGNTALIGGPGTSEQTAGSVSIFTRANGAWTLDSVLPSPAGAAGNPTFGWSAALSADGNTAIVGGEGDNHEAGAAWIYTRPAPGGQWTQQGPKLTAADASPPSLLGISVALSGDGNTAIAGGIGDAGFTGAAWIYTRTNGVWTQQGPKLVGTGAVGNANQGGAVALSADGNIAIVGGVEDSGSTGATWVFTRANGVWSQQGGKLVGTGLDGGPPLYNPRQGSSVALSGDGHTAIVGALDDQPSGAAWVFVSSPAQFAVLAPSVAVAGEPFPVTVTAQFSDHSLDASYHGAIHFSSSDPLAELPPDSQLTNGAGTFTVTLKTAGLPIPVITVMDAANQAITGVSGSVSVQAAANSRFAFSALPSAIVSGGGFNFRVSAFDRFGNFAPSNSARIRFSSTDPAAVLPPDSLLAGSGIFGVVLKTAGNQSITVTDTANSAVTGTSSLIAVITNLAQGKSATQSSTLAGYPTAGAGSAVDGATDGNFFNGSVTATNLEATPWWQVDLGASAAVTSVTLFNRTDCCGSRLADYWVFVSDSPFLATDTPATLQNRGGTFASHQTTAAGSSVTIPVSWQGRYVRVQLNGIDYLSLAEVQVFGTGTPALSNLALGRLAAQSSTLAGYPSAGPASAVDDNADGNFFDGSVTATDLDANPWWQVDLGASASVSSVVIFNRTDCCGSRLADYWVFVSDTPFLAADTPVTLQTRAGTFASHQTTAPDPSPSIPVAWQGRYVRVQLSGAGYLSLAEVQVFGAGGAPAPVNLSAGKTATQSSTLAGYPSAAASSAVDNNPDGNFYAGSVTATNQEASPWWQVDLGASRIVSSVVIFNRTDCCGSRLGDYWVFVSNTPFLATDTPAILQTRAGTFASHQTTAPSPSTSIPVAAPGRYVRVQLSGVNFLSLAEVQVFGQ